VKNRKLALILSFIYCGLGQIYKGQTLKGIDFAIIYTMSIVAYFSSPSLWLQRIGLSVLPAIWIIGMIDAYIVVTQRKQWLLVILPGVFVLLLLMCIQIFMGMDEGPKADVLIADVPPMNDTQSITPPPAEEDVKTEAPPDSLETVQPDLPEFFSIQVGAFRVESLGEAEELRDEMSSKGYQARVEDPKLTKDGWHRVLIGKFRTNQEATAFAEQLRRKENLSYIIVNRRSAE
jgi:hypothetical protein